MSRSPAPYGMLLDRGLTIDQFDIAHGIGVADANPKTNRRALTMALRDVVSEQEAEGKTKKCLTRVWLNPPAESVGMIKWGLEHAVHASERPLLHFGALLATFPFVGSVCRVIGMHLQTERGVEAVVVRSEVRRLLGDRPSVDVAARKTYTTLRNLGLLKQHGQVLTMPDQILNCPPSHAGWLVHALILTRQAESVPETSVLTAPELLGIGVSTHEIHGYRYLEQHAAPSGTVLSLRSH